MASHNKHERQLRDSEGNFIPNPDKPALKPITVKINAELLSRYKEKHPKGFTRLLGDALEKIILDEIDDSKG